MITMMAMLPALGSSGVAHWEIRPAAKAMTNPKIIPANVPQIKPSIILLFRRSFISTTFFKKTVVRMGAHLGLNIASGLMHNLMHQPGAARASLGCAVFPLPNC